MSKNGKHHEGIGEPIYHEVPLPPEVVRLIAAEEMPGFEVAHSDMNCASGRGLPCDCRPILLPGVSRPLVRG